MKKYIDADELIKFANNHIGGIDANDIARFPRADVREVKHGKWIDMGDGDSIKCSVSWCGFIGSKRWAHNYCPNCGAKMDGDEK